MRRADLPRWRGIAVALAVAILTTAPACASGPRWVTGSPYFAPVPAGRPVVWSTTQLLYFTDPGDLSASVNHAAADAIVAAAAGVWNVPTSALTLSSGGTLAEDVSSANTSMGSHGPVFPSDVQVSNSAAIPIAVVYDSDGSLIDMLLGSGASDPAECLQNGVVEDVDSITPFGAIQHAVILLNGRCSGPAPEQQLQLQYQLERVFGRVLGLAWSQTNDNVYTLTPLPTSSQSLHWPIMHPIDIVCGTYTYQCLPQPFTLRDDDIASISALYPVTAPAPSGKVPTWQNAARITGTIAFPTGEGMQGVNVLVSRIAAGTTTPEPYAETSSVSGFLFQQNAGNPVSGAASGISGSMGSPDPQLQGFYDLAWIPQLSPAGSMTAAVTTEPINPLYIGSYTVGPYVLGAVSPSGSSQSAIAQAPAYNGSNSSVVNFAPADAAASCATSDGTEFSPTPVVVTGLWSGLLCGHGHSAWSSLSIAAQRTATIEVTAEDETGAPTTSKSMPLIGVWASSDLMGTPPTLAFTSSAFNTIAFGVSAVHLNNGLAATTRFAIADARGDGRPDFPYQARVLYAASVQPGTVPLSGAQIAISGMGFTQSLTVRINGVVAPVVQTTSTSLVVTAPASPTASTVDITVTDATTGGSTAMLGSLTYSATVQPNRIVLISSPTGTVTTGTPAPAPFSVRIFQSDGVTALAGAPVTFSVSSGAAQLGACGGSSTCIVLTDSTGLASTAVTPVSAAVIGLVASITGASQAVSFNAAVRSLTAIRPVEYVAAAATVTWPAQILATENGLPAPALPVTWTGSASISFQSPTTTNASGIAQSNATVAALASGATALGQACGWTTVCASVSAVAVDASAWRVALVSGGSQSISQTATFVPLIVRIIDPAGHAIAGAPVAIHQTVTAAGFACPTRGSCPMAPILDRDTSVATSDADGLVSITPMQIQGTAEMTNIVVATGTQGFLALSLQQLQ